MFLRLTDRTCWRLLLLSATLLTGAALMTGRSAAAAEEGGTTTSLTLVPADASFYITSLRNREQIDLFYKSNAYKALRAIPFVKEAWTKAMAELAKGDSPLAKYEELKKNKEASEALDLVRDGLSHEVFVYGGKDLNDLFALASQINSVQFAALPEVRRNPADGNNVVARRILRMLQQEREKIKAPELVIGFKVSQPAKLGKYLDHLEKHASKAAEDQPALKGRVKRHKVAGGDFLAVELDGTLLPLDGIPLKGIEEKEGEFKPLFDHLKKSKAVVSIGIRGNYVLLGLTRSIKDLEKLGVKGKTLADRPEMKPLVKHAKKRLTSISYVSKEFATSAMGAYTDLGTMAGTLKQLLAQVDTIKDERRKAIGRDIDNLAQALKKWAPQPGARMGFSFLSEAGWESYAYNYTRHEALKGVKLDLHHHFGGSPIFAAAFAFKLDGNNVDGLIQWIKTIHGHAEGLFLDSADDNAKDVYKKFMQAARPLLERLENTTKKVLVPALKEGGLGVVLDGKWSSKQWLATMPATERAIPFLELGLLVGASDAGKFAEAMKIYRTTFNELWSKLREVAPAGADIPDFSIPAPDTEKGKNGTLHFYRQLAGLGIDKQVEPTMGVGKRVSALTLSRAHADRLLARTPLKATSGPLARKGDLLGVCYLDWPAFIDTIAPWIEFGVGSTVIVPGDDAEAAKKIQEEAKKAMQQVNEFLKILKAFQGIRSATFVEGDAVVTHTEIGFKDIEAPAEPK